MVLPPGVPLPSNPTTPSTTTTPPPSATTPTNPINPTFPTPQPGQTQGQANQDFTWFKQQVLLLYEAKLVTPPYGPPYYIIRDPATGKDITMAWDDPYWETLYTQYLASTAAAGGVTGGGGGYYGGGGGGGGMKYYPQFDYNQAQGLWNTYITKQGFGRQDRQGDWARDYYNQSLLDFNSDWAKKNPPKAIPAEGTETPPAIAQTTDYNSYLKRAFGPNSLKDIYAGLSGARRGDQYNRYAGAGRTISWG